MSVPTLGPASGSLGFGKKKPAASRLAGGLGGAQAQALGSNSLADRGAGLADGAPQRGAANATAGVPQMGSELASVRNAAPVIKKVAIEDLPAPETFKQEDEVPVYIYPLEFLEQMSQFYQDPDPDISSQIAFLSEGTSKKISRPFGMMGSNSDPFAKTRGQTGGGGQQTQDGQDAQGPMTMGMGMMGLDRSIFGQSKVEQDEFLKKSDDAYVVGAKELDDLGLTMKVINGALNKLTPEKYAKVSREFLAPELGLWDEQVEDNEIYFSKTIDEIFKRAIDQVIYVEMYANLAKDICDFEVELMRKKDKDAQTSSSKFRRILIDKVQQEHENRAAEVKAAEEDEEEPEERKQRIAKSQKRMIGNTKFVGELYNKRLLTDRIMHRVVQDLLYGGPLRAGGEADMDYMPKENDLDVLLELMFCIGYELEERARPSNPMCAMHRAHIDSYMKKLLMMSGKEGKDPVTGKPYQARLRFKIQDMMDERKKGWPGSKSKKALTIEEFQALEEQKERMKLEGVRTANYAGEGSAWGKAATVSDSMADLKSSGAASTSTQKGGGKKRGKDDGGGAWDTAKQKQKGGGKDAPATSGKKKNAPQVTQGRFNAISVSGGAKPDSKADKAEKAKAAAAEKEKLAKKKKDAEKAKRVQEKEEVDKPPKEDNMPEGFTDKIKGRYQEGKNAADEDLPEDWNFDQKDRPLVVQELVRLAVKEKDDGERGAVVDFIKKLVDVVGMLKQTDVVRGLGWFVCTAIATQMKEDMPALWSRFITVFRALLPPAEDYGSHSRVYVVAIRAIEASLKETEETEYLDESVFEIFAEVWKKAHCSWGAIDAATEEEWQTAVLAEVVRNNSQTGWMQMADPDDPDTKLHLIDAQMRFLKDTNFMPAERFTELKESLLEQSAGDKNTKQERSAKAAQLLADFLGIEAQDDAGGEEEGEEGEADE